MTSSNLLNLVKIQLSANVLERPKQNVYGRMTDVRRAHDGDISLNGHEAQVSEMCDFMGSKGVM